MTHKPQEPAPARRSGLPAPSPTRRGDRQAIRDILAFLAKLAVTLLAGWVLLGVVFGLAVQQGEDMYPRLRDGDLMLYYRLQQTYYVGDVVTFVRDGQRYTGRIVAQGGDTVDLTGDGELLVNGNTQSEEVFYPTQPVQGGIELPCTVPEDGFFLLCDFRTNATDSRSYGTVLKKDLDGKVITILRRRGI